MKTIAILNQKGGVGKTTISVNLSHALALAGHRVMAIDLDPQGHLSASFGIFKQPLHGVFDVFNGERTLTSVKINTREGLQLIPAGANLREIEEASGNVKEQMHLLKKAITDIEDKPDYIILDCPPSSGLLGANAILAVDEILIPVSGDYLSLNGLAHLMITLKRFEAVRDTPMRTRIVLSRFVARRRLSQEVLDKLLEHFPGMIMKTFIREVAALSECPGAGRTIFEYKAKSSSAEDFRQLALDVVEGNVLT